MSRVDKIALISTGLALLSFLLFCYATSFFYSNGSPAWFLVILVTLFVSTLIGLIYAVASARTVKHFVVTKIGIQTTATVIHSQRCDDNEDVCVCGTYIYHDRLNWEHKAKFRYCWHWPSNEDWDKVMQSCGLGAENPVYYLPWLPFIHDIQWTVDNDNIDERPIPSR